jgi:hypothetical protein
MDVVRNRPFRTTLLVRGEQRPLTDGFTVAPIPSMYAGTTLAPVSERPDLTSSEPEKFQAPDGFVLETDEPPLKTALAYLCSVEPTAVPVMDVWRVVCDHLGAPPTDGLEGLTHNLLRGALVNVIDLHVTPPRFTRQVTTHPLASPWARLQALRGPRVTTLLHKPAEMEPIFRALLIRLDGRHDRAQLLAELMRDVERGALSIRPPDGDAPFDPRRLLDGVLDVALQRLAAHALLLA